MQVIVPLDLPYLGRQGAALGALQSPVAQPGGQGLDGAITHSSDGSTGQFS